MGFGQSKNKTNIQTKIKENNKTNKIFQKNESFNIASTNKMSNRVKECIIQLSPFEKIDFININASKSICKLKIENGSNIISGTGFLLNFYIGLEHFYCLISNEHVITQNIINNNTIIYIYYDNENKVANLKLDTKKRYIKSFIDIDLDITVVEILDEDNIYKDYFLWKDPSEIIKNRFY